MIKKIMYAICMVGVVAALPIEAYAKEPVVLFEEFFEGASIKRLYSEPDGNVSFQSIFVPEKYLTQVNKASDPLLEAKKVLTLYYKQNNMTSKLNELDNKTVEWYDPSWYTPTVSPELKALFDAQKKAAYDYANGKLNTQVTVQPTKPAPSPNKPVSTDTKVEEVKPTVPIEKPKPAPSKPVVKPTVPVEKPSTTPNKPTPTPPKEEPVVDKTQETIQQEADKLNEQLNPTLVEEEQEEPENLPTTNEQDAPEPIVEEKEEVITEEDEEEVVVEQEEKTPFYQKEGVVATGSFILILLLIAYVVIRRLKR